MDKVKEKFNRLRIESESNLERASKAEDELKSISEKLLQAETTIKDLNAKNLLLEQEYERDLDQLNKYKDKELKSEQEGESCEALNRKIATLEKTLSQKENLLDSKTFRIKELEAKNDEIELKDREYVSEISKLQKELDDVNAKYNRLKAELEDTYKALDQL